MTSRRSRLARPALVAAVVALAVLGAVYASSSDDFARGAASVVAAKATAVAAPQPVVERTSPVERLATDVVFAATIAISFLLAGWVLAQRASRRVPPASARLTWRRRGPPLSFIS